MSVSRRTFFLGTTGLFAVCALAMAVFYYLMGLVEQATGGWGVNGRFFALQWIAQNNWAIQILFYFTLMMLLFLIGFFCAVIYLRWRTTGMLLLGIGAALVVLAGIAVLTWRDAWGQLGSWLAGFTAGTTTLTGLGCAVVLGAISWLALRKATA